VDCTHLHLRALEGVLYASAISFDGNPEIVRGGTSFLMYLAVGVDNLEVRYTAPNQHKYVFAPRVDRKSCCRPSARSCGYSLLAWCCNRN